MSCNPHITININGCSCGETHLPATALKILVQNYPGQTVQLIGDSMVSLTTTQKVDLTVQAFAGSKPSTVDGPPVWTVADPTLASITPAADGMTATLVAAAAGSTQVSVQADADMSSGVRLISAVPLDVQITAPEADSLVITAGTPVEQ